MRLHVEARAVGPSTTLLVVTGVIDWSTVSRFRAILNQHVSRPGSEVLVDLTGLQSWSSPGQATLLAAATTARLHSGRLAIFGLPPVPGQQARRSGLDRVLHPFVTQAEAEAAVAVPATRVTGPHAEPPLDLPSARRPPVATSTGPAAPASPAGTSERRRRRADASARWNVQRQHQWSFVRDGEDVADLRGST